MCRKEYTRRLNDIRRSISFSYMTALIVQEHDSTSTNIAKCMLKKKIKGKHMKVFLAGPSEYSRGPIVSRNRSDYI